MKLPGSSAWNERKLRIALEKTQRVDSGDYLEEEIAFDKWAVARSNRVLSDCRKLDIPVPLATRDGQEPENSLWADRTYHASCRFLNDQGIFELSKTIDQVRKRRFESFSRWVTLLATVVGTLTGLVGATIGLVSVWH